MPKKISANQDTIIEVAKQIIKDEKYDELNCRTIAKKVGIGVGTLYHFFRSKDEILAYIMLQDWKKQLTEINTRVTIEEGIKNIYEGLRTFSTKYFELWKYTRSSLSEYNSYSSKHSIIIEQIKKLINSLLDFNSLVWEDIEVEFIGESMLSYSTRLYPYSRMEKIFIKLIGGKNNG